MKKIYISACLLLAINAWQAAGQTKTVGGLTPRTAPVGKTTPIKKPQTPMKSSTPSKAEAPKQTATASKSKVQYEVINGIRVILKPATNDVIGAVLFITGGVKNYSLADQGIEELALNVALEGGSKNYPKEKWHNLLEQKGISMDANSSYDYSTISLKTIDKNWNTAWDMLADIVKNPAWDDQSFEQVKGQTTSGLMQQQSDPDSKIREMSITNTFKGTPYESNPEGTPESVNVLTLDKLKSHYANIMKRKKMVLSVVGKISMDDLRRKVQAAFASVPEGTQDPFATKPPVIPASSVTIEEREIATNYIQGIFPSPAMGTREFTAMRIGTSILSDRLFVEVRTKRNLSYAPNAYVASLFNPYGSVYVSTTQPNDAVQVMMDEIRKIKKEGFTEKELRDKKEGFLTSFYMGQETNEAQALTYGISEIRGSWQKAETFKDEVYSLTTADLNNVFRKYASAISWYYLGDKAKVDESIFKAKLD